MSDLLPEDLTPPHLCNRCAAVIQLSDKFCGSCGERLEQSSPEPRVDIFELIRPSLLYYFITLVLMLVYKTTDIFPDGFEGMVWITVLDISIVIIFWIQNHDQLSSLFSLSGIKASIAFMTALTAIAGAFLVTLLANWINVAISSDVFYDTYLFQDTAYPLLISILFICVQPALFEEVAFRGFLYNNLQKVSTSNGSIYITSFVFGIIHLSFISLIWLVPLGLAFAFLRLKYNTLWYGMIGHFMYNLTIVLIDSGILLN